MGLELAAYLGFEGLAALLFSGAVTLAAGVALSYGAQFLTGASSTASKSSGISGAQASLSIAADVPRTAIVGETALAGHLVYWHLTGANNDQLCMIISLADHECDSLTGVVVDGVLKTFATSPTATPGGHVNGYGDKLRVRFHSGAPGQAANAEAIAGSAGRWTAAERGEGVCYVAVFATYDATLFPGGIPKLQFVVRGANQLLDPRTGARGYSDNWGVAVYNVLRGIRQGVNGPPVVGLNAVADSVRSADIIAACNASDENVVTLAGNEKRYRAAVVLQSSSTTQTILELLLAASAGQIVESAGIYRVFAGVAKTPVAAVTDADLISGKPFRVTPKKTRAQLVNTVEGTFLDPARVWVPVALPPRYSSADVATDGGARFTRSFDLTGCPSRTQAQRVMEIERRRARRQLVAACTVRAAFCGLEAGDWVTFTSARQGWTNRVFEVATAPRTNDLTSDLTLIETDDTIDDWTVADEIADGTAASLPSAGPTLSTVGGLALSLFTSQSGSSGAQRPGLRLAYTPITDGTVISLRVQYRKVSTPDDVLEITAPDPTAGSFAWINGVQGGASYEARARLVTLPERAVDWSTWVVTPDATAPVIVDTAQSVVHIDPDQLPPPLTAQERFELSLSSAIADVQGSAASILTEARNAAQRAAEAAMDGQIRARTAQTGVRVLEQTTKTANLALAEQITTLTAQLGDSGAAALAVERQARVDADAATASQVTTLATTVGGHTNAISELISVDSNRGGKWSISLSVDGYATGFVTLDGTGSGSTFGVLADKFFVAQPGVAGGAPKQIFTIGNVNGTPTIVMDGVVVKDGSLTARHLAANSITTDALAASVITARRIASDDGFSYLDFTPGNKRLRFVGA